MFKTFIQQIASVDSIFKLSIQFSTYTFLFLSHVTYCLVVSSSCYRRTILNVFLMKSVYCFVRNTLILIDMLGISSILLLWLYLPTILSYFHLFDLLATTSEFGVDSLSIQFSMNDVILICQKSLILPSSSFIMHIVSRLGVHWTHLNVVDCDMSCCSYLEFQKISHLNILLLMSSCNY